MQKTGITIASITASNAAKACWNKRRQNPEFDASIKSKQSATRKKLWQNPEFKKMMVSHQYRKIKSEMNQQGVMNAKI